MYSADGVCYVELLVKIVGKNCSLAVLCYTFSSAK